MREARELSAQTGDAVRWFIYTFTLLLPWISLGVMGPWVAIVTACVAVGFWLWWVHPPIGLNRRPTTHLLTFLLIATSGIVLIVAETTLLEAAARRTSQSP